MTIQLIGAGFGRTGTTSIKAALEELGFGPCYHMIEVLTHPAHVPVWSGALGGRTVDWRTFLAHYGAIVDWPGCTFYQELMAVYPEAKVLLTVREPEVWYESTRNTIYRLPRSPVMRTLRFFVPHLRHFFRMNDQFIWQGAFSGNFEDRQQAIATFQAHIEAVKQAVPAERLLVYDVRDGWEPLCAFLNVPAPQGKPFPRLNDTATVRRMLWLSLIALAGILAALVGLVWWFFHRFTKRTKAAI
ncbi:MAG: hypothetical protein KJZ93_15180 [Caldilineaceae bacterium]|nr:hypothetical protein [Caldilineaceae bacterium]